MKLEEVLPAMREGRVAIDECGDRYKFACDHYHRQSFDGKWRPATMLSTHGWTLEPEPKVEWPKGSLQWACAQVECLTQKIARKGHGWNVAVGAIDRTHIGWDSFFALDWEVVP